MANSFAVLRSFRYGGREGARRVVFEGVLTIDTVSLAGATAGDLPAATFNGLTTITKASPLVKSTDASCYIPVPAYAGGSLLVKAASAITFTDLSLGAYAVTVEGIK